MQRLGAGGGGSDAAVYGLELQCRSLAAATDDEKHLFILGTLSLRGKNQLYYLEYKEDAAFCECLAMWNHPSEIWQVAPCPAQDKKHLFFTAHATADHSSRSATLWSKEFGTTKGLTKMQPLDFPCSKVLWEPQGMDVGTVLCLQGAGCPADAQGVATAKLDAGGQRGALITIPAECVHSGAWDPHHSDVVCLAGDSALWQVDLRQRQPAQRLGAAHPVVRDCEFNPNKQYSIATCGDDGAIKFWDIRKGAKVVKTVKAHDHWCCCVRFNPYHEQLVLSSSTDRDATVKLWNLPSVAHDGCQPGAAEGVLRGINEYEDSVYAVAWSGLSPWVFASVSYNGKVLVHQVPRETKYSILLADDHHDPVADHSD
eukprot:TRINITY_DN57115_c0_g1_i1.p1 TRINITY_DN57115_c0_g1~~TRINITY_DN57115_c0_g1_i1.p1  ORF type:complete len:390 (+),score=107.68 TRINITY_DN57115_c0_g1_i1:63-1172(+)